MVTERRRTLPSRLAAEEKRCALYHHPFHSERFAGSGRTWLAQPVIRNQQFAISN